MVDPDDAAPRPKAMIGKLREDAIKSAPPTASHVAARLLRTALQKEASSTEDNQTDGQALRRRPTMWR
jgi:hypothetical protein